MNGINFLTQVAPKSSFCPATMWTQQEDAVYEHECRLSLDTESADILNLDSSASRADF